MKEYLIVLLAVFSVSAGAAVVERPSQNYPKIALNSYSWLTDYKKTSLTLNVNDAANKFMNEDSLRRYLKLKMRNFVKDIELLEDPKGYEHNYLNLKLELFKYNDTSNIYYGLMSLKLLSAVAFDGSDEKIYELTTSIAGSESQLTTFIKQEIDQMVEVYAEDYYYIDELSNKDNKRVNQVVCQNASITQALCFKTPIKPKVILVMDAYLVKAHCYQTKRDSAAFTIILNKLVGIFFGRRFVPIET